jgi:hypothetical protein
LPVPAEAARTPIPGNSEFKNDHGPTQPNMDKNKDLKPKIRTVRVFRG